MKTKKKVPANACRLLCGSFELRASDQPAANAPRAATILARSGKGIEHWYWGKLVNDFAGMEQLQDRLPLDYCHDSEQILGYAEGWSKDSGDLSCTGTLLTEESERAAEIVRLSDAGVPYQASITFTPINVEQLKFGSSAVVNGLTVDGPAAIVRQWRLTGLAVCPRGADPNTKTQLSAGAGEIDVDFLNEKEIGKMTDHIETTEQITARVQQELTDRISDYSQRFGQPGQGWALSNRPLADCYQDHVTALAERHATELAAAKATHDAAIADLQGQLAAKATEATELAERLESLSLGEKKPVTTAPAEGADASELTADEQKELRAGLTPSLAKHVAMQRRAKAAAAK